MRKESLDDDVSILQKNINDASHDKEKDQEEITHVDSKEEELNEP